jgi:hypothetical protein
MSHKKPTPRNNFLIISTSILASLLFIILILAMMLVKKARIGNRLAGTTASTSTPALVQENPTNPSPALVTPSATATAIPSATETPLPTATPSPLPLPTPTPTPLNTAQVKPGSNAYCRKGPGIHYDAVTYLQAGSTYQVVGRDSLNTWWQIQFTPEVRCWEGDPASILEGPVELAPLVPAPPLPAAPSFFTNKSHCDPVLNTMTVWLSWRAASGASGYRIYRNGELIAELEVRTTSFTELAPRFVNLNYRLEAFNEYGVSPDSLTIIKACL